MKRKVLSYACEKFTVHADRLEFDGLIIIGVGSDGNKYWLYDNQVISWVALPGSNSCINTSYTTRAVAIKSFINILGGAVYAFNGPHGLGEVMEFLISPHINRDNTDKTEFLGMAIGSNIFFAGALVGAEIAIWFLALLVFL